MSIAVIGPVTRWKRSAHTYHGTDCFAGLMLGIYFATDLHASETCWRKFLNAARFYQVEVLICGGDMTGKAMVPIVKRDRGFEVWDGRGDPLEVGQVAQSDKMIRREGGTTMVSTDEIDDVEKSLRRMGQYPIRVTPTQLEELAGDIHLRETTFRAQMVESMARWMEIAEEKLRGTGVRCVLCPGNDDDPEIDKVLAQCSAVEMSEGRVLELADFELISTGWVNPTPWKTFREEPEEALKVRIEAMTRRLHEPSRAIFAFHAPPLRSGLDEAPALDGDRRVMYGGAAVRPVGSAAVREAIDALQPMLALHGHVHEASAARKLGRTLAINPGSSYDQGQLRGCVVRLDVRKGVASYQLVNG